MSMLLTSEQRRRVIRVMKRDRPLAWPSEDELAREFIATAVDVLSVRVDEAEARVAVAGRFRD